ncbi:MAG: hypothetical protein PHD04_05270 [Candidatus Pacebacteria bacterium]|nr:hypothetical protein [Candidatus Paceibacterota bacterium]
MSKRKKAKVKVIYRTPRLPREDNEKKIKEEIKELAEKKAQLGSGWRNKLRGFALNKQINEKSQFLRNKQALLNIESNTAALKKRIELEKARNELNDLRKKREVNFGGFGGASSKSIELKDLGL